MWLFKLFSNVKAKISNKNKPKIQLLMHLDIVRYSYSVNANMKGCVDSTQRVKDLLRSTLYCSVCLLYINPRAIQNK